MSLTPEQRDELAVLIHKLNGCDSDQPCQPDNFDLEDVDALAPVIANWLAAEREAGAAEVRARVEAVLTAWADRSDMSVGEHEAIRAALSTEEPS